MAFTPPRTTIANSTLKATPGKTPLPAKTVLPAPKVKRPSYTAAQEATMHAKALLAPQYQQADAEAARQNQAIQAYTTAVMQQLAGLAPSVGQPFTQAANAQEGMVNAAANSLRAVNPSGDVAKLLAAVGAPQAQTNQIQGNLNNTFNGGAAVGQYMGALPIDTLGEAPGRVVGPRLHTRSRQNRASQPAVAVVFERRRAALCVAQGYRA